jgi:hypothetical protein
VIYYNKILLNFLTMGSSGMRLTIILVGVTELFAPGTWVIACVCTLHRSLSMVIYIKWKLRKILLSTGISTYSLIHQFVSWWNICRLYLPLHKNLFLNIGGQLEFLSYYTCVIIHSSHNNMQFHIILFNIVKKIPMILSHY